jgi:drug/metabolite transporter (DMT)-like permease
MSRRGVVRCGFAAVLFGISAPAASRLAGEMGAFTLAGLLYLGAALAVAPFAARGRPNSRSLVRGGPRLAAAVVFGGAIGPVLLATGLRDVPAPTASLLLNLELVFTTVLAHFVFREHLGRRVISGTCLVAAAGVVLAWSVGAEFRWGAVLIAAACLCWAIDNCVTANLDELTPAQITLTKGVIAGGANLAIGLALGGSIGGWSLIAALTVGGFGYGASITLWVAGARDLGAARGQLVFATAPFVGAIVAWTVLADPVTAREMVALVVAAVGVGFVLNTGHEHEHHHEPIEHDHEHVHDDGHHDHEHPGLVVASKVRHQHQHRHEPMAHAHPHVPDLHHHHQHERQA